MQTTKKSVSFCKIVLIHFVDEEDRRGHWVMDRIHFHKRISDTEKVLCPIFESLNRERAFERVFREEMTISPQQKILLGRSSD